jgi:hypothetical protein
MSTRHRPGLLFVLFALFVVIAVIVAGCGQSADGTTTEQTTAQSSSQTTGTAGSPTTASTAEQASTTQGSGSVSVSAGDMTWTLGEGVSIPEGFPTALLPDGANVVSAVSTSESGSPVTLVVFEATTKPEATYEWFLDALPGAGFEVGKKVFMDGGDQGSALAIEAQGSAGNVIVSGGGKTGENFTYTVMVK